MMSIEYYIEIAWSVYGRTWILDSQLLQSKKVKGCVCVVKTLHAYNVQYILLLCESPYSPYYPLVVILLNSLASSKSHHHIIQTQEDSFER